MSKEKIIIGLKKQIENLRNMKADIDSHIEMLGKHIEELQDDSKLGVLSDYDFGREGQGEVVKSLEKDLKKGVKEVKKTQKEAEKTQRKEEGVVSRVVDDSVTAR